MAGAVGLEPTPSSLTVRCPTNWTTPQPFLDCKREWNFSSHAFLDGLDFTGIRTRRNEARPGRKALPPYLGPYKVYEYGERGRGKEAGPALNPLKGSSAFPPSDGITYRTPGTKLILLKTHTFRLSPPRKKSNLQGKISRPHSKVEIGSV